MLPDATISTATGTAINIPWGFTESSLELSPGISASSEQSEIFEISTSCRSSKELPSI